MGIDIKTEIKNLPLTCGVYIMKDPAGEVLYVGKAGNIKKRVSSYFYKKYVPSARLDALISKVAKIENIPTTCEGEALILESSLIKKYKPRYNVELKDDKSYPYLKLTLAETYPRLFITRKMTDDGSRYFGPYTNVKLLREATYMIKRIFSLRVCNKLPKHVCLNYYLRQCVGPCVGNIDKTGYDEIVKELILFLEGKKDALLEELTKRMAIASAKLNFEEAARIRNRIEALSAMVRGKVKFNFKDILEELRQVLRLEKPPMRIEAFDISNFAGDQSVGSMISFYNMKFDRALYRKFKIKTVDGIDDYKMMREVISRRYRRVLDEKLPLPDLVIIDGGKGHLSTAKDELDKLGLSRVPVIGIAKEFEHIYLPDQKEPLKLPRNSSILQLIQRIRDEAHRFAISYHHLLRERESYHSELDAIEGIGETRKRALLRHFGALENIKKARMDELLQVKGITKKVAKEIASYFKRQ